MFTPLNSSHCPQVWSVGLGKPARRAHYRTSRQEQGHVHTAKLLPLSAGLEQPNINFFKKKLQRYWLALYTRHANKKKTTSNFEHVFMGEVRKTNKSEKSDG